MKESRYLFNARFLILYFAVRKAPYDMPKMRCISSSSFPMSVRSVCIRHRTVGEDLQI